MLGKTASGLFWMFRNLERSENTARLVEVGFRMSLTRTSSNETEWASIVTTAGCSEAYLERYDGYDTERVIDFLLRDRDNPSSVMSVIEAARNNARMVRTALTREVWEAMNGAWLVLKDVLVKPVSAAALPGVLASIRQQGALVRAALHGTMLRNDIFRFARLGSFVERADNMARILDVKYYVLLPSTSYVGSSLDNVQWETILRSASAERSFNWIHGGETTPRDIADFLILDRQMPRSLIYCVENFTHNLRALCPDIEASKPSQVMAETMMTRLRGQSIEQVFETGLHEFLVEFRECNDALAAQIEIDFRFYE
jgi:uncharacterized alpha-E superfamily protein